MLLSSHAPELPGTLLEAASPDLGRTEKHAERPDVSGTGLCAFKLRARLRAWLAAHVQGTRSAGEEQGAMASASALARPQERGTGRAGYRSVHGPLHTPKHSLRLRRAAGGGPRARRRRRAGTSGRCCTTGAHRCSASRCTRPRSAARSRPTPCRPSARTARREPGRNSNGWTHVMKCPGAHPALAVCPDPAGRDILSGQPRI